MRTRFSSTVLIAIAIALVALVLYLPGVWWGAPYATAADRTHAWGVDDETPLGPIGEIANLRNPRPERNLGYPLLYSFVVGAAYAPYLGFLWLTGGMTRPGGEYPFGLADPVQSLQLLTWIAHGVTVLMASGTVAAAYLAGSTLWDRRTGVLSALFVMLSFPMFYYARTGNVDVPVLFFTAAALAVFARVLVHGLDVKRAVGLGIFVGCALATKEPSFASFLALPLIVLVVELRRASYKVNRLAPKFWQAAAASLVAAFLAFGIGSGLFVDPERYLAHLAFAFGRGAEANAGQIVWIEAFPHTLEGQIRLGSRIVQYLVDAMTFPGLVLAIVGIVLAARYKRITLFFLLPAVTYLAVLAGLAHTAQLRYLMPVAFTLSFFAAFSLAWWSRSNTRPVRVMAWLVAGGVLFYSFLIGVELTFAMINDSRYAAAVWLARETRPGDRVEYFGYSDHLPPLPLGVTTSPTISSVEAVRAPTSAGNTISKTVEGWDARKPEYIILVPDFMSAPDAPYSGACPPEIYQGLMSSKYGYEMAAFFQTPRLFPWLPMPQLDYPVVNPPIHIFVRNVPDLT
ncbi:MAG: glycosyltransferase family 39 protein [Anaerolineae bacterium]|nr:glycosyltransferase family 39 protein [Anaerolineae bacterium]